jgi:NADPH:quinone reductase-like Zn-dependent oxidoreductase
LIKALQFARLSGFTTIIANGSKANESLIKKFGATHFIDRGLSVDEQASKIHSIAPSLEYAWDAIGAKDTSTLAARAFGPEGGLIVSSLPISADVLGEYKNVKGKNINSSPLTHQESAAKVWSNLEEALKKGDFKPLPYKIAPGGIAGIAEALHSVKKASGYKVVVHAQE